MAKKTYYSAQESAYQTIRNNGEAGWLRKTMDEFRDAKTDAIIGDYVRKHFHDVKGLKALDIGTGTGSTAHTLHDLGFQVTGIDVCPSAIELGREIAKRTGKAISFEVSDVLSLNTKFDLIYDSHCSHCIVFNEDRSQFFKTIYSSLKAGGAFILDSMVFKNSFESWKDAETLRLDESFILWHKTKEASHTGTVKIGDTYWCPQRRIYPAEKLLSELSSNGFKIISHSIDEQDDSDVSMLRALITL